VRPAAAGAGGLDEMQRALPRDGVSFGLARVEMGSGAFSVAKLLFLTAVGEEASALVRARTSALKGQVRQQLGVEVHAEVALEATADCTVDVVLGRVASLFVNERGVQAGGVAALKAAYVEMLRKASGPAGRLTAADLGGRITAQAALAHVRNPIGPFNWALFRPHKARLDLVNAGSLSLREMRDWLAPDQTLFGLLRMGFGAGQFRRTKFVAIWWTGPDASALQRGLAQGMQGACLARVEPFSVRVTATSLEDMTLGAVISRVRGAAVIDGAGHDSARASAGDPFSETSFQAALDEEMRANADFFGDAGDAAEGAAADVSGRTAAEVAADVRGGRYNWAIFNTGSG